LEEVLTIAKQRDRTILLRGTECICGRAVKEWVGIWQVPYGNGSPAISFAALEIRAKHLMGHAWWPGGKKDENAVSSNRPVT